MAKKTVSTGDTELKVKFEKYQAIKKREQRAATFMQSTSIQINTTIPVNFLQPDMLEPGAECFPIPIGIHNCRIVLVVMWRGYLKEETTENA